MNEFTKEELEELRASRCYHLNDSFPADDNLFMKIQSMIETYDTPQAIRERNEQHGGCF